MKKNKKGFTLTELIIVIVVIGVLAAVLIPSLSSYVKKAKISKGTQNARNLTTLLIGEVLFNDKEYLLPSDVVRVANESGYDLISEVDGYAYWYDSSTNTVIYKSIEESLSAADNKARSRIEALSPTHPDWFYIDQTDNSIKKTIDTINNLVEKGLEKTGLTAENAKTSENRLRVLNAMDEIVYSLRDEVNELKLGTSIRSQIVDYISSYNTYDTIYYCEHGWFNKQLQASENKTNYIAVERGLILDGTINIPEDGQYGSVYVDFLAPVLVPNTVNKLPNQFLTTINSGTLAISSNTILDSSKLKDDVVLASLATVERINYISLELQPKYEFKEYRLQNGHIFVVQKDRLLEIKTNGILVTTKADGTDVQYYKEVDNTYLTYDNKWISDDQESSIKEGYTESILLSMYMIPTIEVSNEEISKILTISNFFQTLVTDDAKTCKISIRSSMEPFSVRFTGIIVNKFNEGYRIDNVGYITDVILNYIQGTKDENGNVVVYQNNQAEVNCYIPDAAKNFVNFKDIKMEVEFVPQSLEYSVYKPLGQEESFIVPTGKIYYAQTPQQLEVKGDLYSGFNGKINDLSQFDFEGHDCNQIQVTKVTIKDKEGNVLFVRYYK